jgi:hypothetical protein
LSYFDIEANDLLSSQQSQLNELLIKNKELFVTKENPKLGIPDVNTLIPFLTVYTICF